LKVVGVFVPFFVRRFTEHRLMQHVQVELKGVELASSGRQRQSGMRFVPELGGWRRKTL
jgi:hypothetical protein